MAHIPRLSIAVIGAGAIGLTTAINIQLRLPDAEVTVIAEQIGDGTTTAGAGGLSRPQAEHMGGTDEGLVKKWFKDSFEEFDRLSNTEEAGQHGVFRASGYQFSEEPMDPLYRDSVYSFHELSPNELRRLAPLSNEKRYGYLVTSLFTEGQKYQNYLTDRFKSNGGKFENRRVNSMEELVGKYAAVANCCGLGARHLVGDMKVYPRRGHLVKVHAPWVKQFVYAAGDTYIFPLSDCVALGGCSQKDNYSLEVDHDDADGILERCCKIMPSLKNATVLNHWVGLRPHRDPVRLEKEVMTFPSGQLKVVHNYGHGRFGICLSWGSGVDAADKIVQLVKKSSLSPKL